MTSTFSFLEWLLLIIPKLHQIQRNVVVYWQYYVSISTGNAHIRSTNDDVSAKNGRHYPKRWKFKIVRHTCELEPLLKGINTCITPQMSSPAYLTPPISPPSLCNASDASPPKPLHNTSEISLQPHAHHLRYPPPPNDNFSCTYQSCGVLIWWKYMPVYIKPLNSWWHAADTKYCDHDLDSPAHHSSCLWDMALTQIVAYKTVKSRPLFGRDLELT